MPWISASVGDDQLFWSEARERHELRYHASTWGTARRSFEGVANVVVVDEYGM